MMSDDYFWWFEHVDQVMDWELRSAQKHAMEVMGASKRQERLEAQRTLLQSIGEEHEEARDGNDPEDEEDAVPHEHGGQPEVHSANGEPCDIPTCRSGQVIQEHTCPSCKGEGTHNGESWTTGRTCVDCEGTGKITDSVKYHPHTHPTPAKPYVEQSETIHTLKDGWSVKRLKTYGDLKYEGEMMNHCVKEDASGSAGCDSCDGNGYCRDCGGSGHVSCDDCGGDGTIYCSTCDGGGRSECPVCDDSVKDVTEECSPCKGTGSVEVCKGCGYDKPTHVHNVEHYPVRDDGTPNAHEYEPKKEECRLCHGHGSYRTTVATPGEVDCDECEGTGKDWEDKQCEGCEGEGKMTCPHCEGSIDVSCDDCGGEGTEPCESCGGDGNFECGTCEGSRACQECGGTGAGGGGPANYYRAYSQEDADHFSRAPGGPFSLRNPDNIPSVTFLETKTYGFPYHNNPKNIDNVFGREDEVPSAPHQHRILEYLKSRMGHEGQLPFEGHCDTCGGKGTIPRTLTEHCGECGGRGYFGGNSDVPARTPCDKCEHGKVHTQVDDSCVKCHGTGEDTVGVSWHTKPEQRFTGNEIDAILKGEHPRPDVMLLAQHKQNKNEIHTFKDNYDAHRFGETATTVKEVTPCSHCEGTGDDGHVNPGSLVNCHYCGGDGKSISTHNALQKEVYDLHAMPSISIGKDSMLFNPAEQSWEVKSGRGAKIPLEQAGAKVPWKAVADDAYCSECEGRGHALSHRCDACQGTGWATRTCEHCGGDGCGTCLGTGRRNDGVCATCDGGGNVQGATCEGCGGTGHNRHEVEQARQGLPAFAQEALQRVAHLGLDNGAHHVIGLPHPTPQEVPSMPEVASEVDEAEHEVGDRAKAKLGATTSGMAVWYDPDMPGHRLANEHLSITGESGSGKTQAMKTIMADLHDEGIPALVLDFKDDYSEASYGHHELFTVYDPTTQPLPLNPLVPPMDRDTGMVNTTYHAYQLSEIIARVYRLGDLQAYNLREAISEAYADAGLPKGSFVPSPTQQWPLFQSIKAKLAAKKDNTELIGHMSPIFDFGLFSSPDPKGFADIANANTVIRLGQLPGNEVKNSVAEFFLMALYNHLIRQPQVHSLVRILVLDEAWRVVNSPFLEPLMREGRAFGLGIFVATQFPTDLPLTVSGNTASQIFFSQSDPAQISEIERIVTGHTRTVDADALGDAVRGLLPLQGVLHNKHYVPYVKFSARPYFARDDKAAAAPEVESSLPKAASRENFNMTKHSASFICIRCGGTTKNDTHVCDACEVQVPMFDNTDSSEGLQERIDGATGDHPTYSSLELVEQVSGWKKRAEMVAFPPGREEEEESPFAPFSTTEYQFVKGPKKSR